MGLIVLDAGPIIAVLDDDDVHHAAAVSVLSESEAAGKRFVVPAVAYAECLVHPAQRGPRAMDAVDKYLSALAASIEPITSSIARTASRLRATHGNRLPLPDALVVATALEISAEAILTTDAGWPHLSIRVEVIGE